MTKLTGFLFAFSAYLFTLKQVQAGVTVYLPVPTDPALQEPSIDIPKIIGVSAVGIASDGATQYVATEVASAHGFATGTLTFSPTTYVVSFEEGASTFRMSQAISTTTAGVGIAMSEDINCGPGNGGLNCVILETGEISIAGGQPIQTTFTPTYAATESPIFTITGTAVPLSTAKSSASHATPFMVPVSMFMCFAYALVSTM